MVCRIDGIAEHKVVADALQVLQNQREHHTAHARCDPDSGDRTKFSSRFPTCFSKEVGAPRYLKLGKPGDCAVGVIIQSTAALDECPRSLT